MDDPLIKWLGIGLLILVVILGIAIYMAWGDSNIVCEINPLDTTDVFCYEPE